MANETPNVDLQDAFNARVIGVLVKYEKEKRKQRIKQAVFLIAGALVGYGYALLTNY